MTRRRALYGFTLVEILVVVMIISILLVAVAGITAFAFRKAKEAQARVELQEIQTALTSYKMQHGVYPEEAELAGDDIAARLAGSIQRGPSNELLDPWETPYVYLRATPYVFELYSCGADGRSGNTADDADNIE